MAAKRHKEAQKRQEIEDRKMKANTNHLAEKLVAGKWQNYGFTVIVLPLVFRPAFCVFLCFFVAILLSVLSAKSVVRVH